MKTREIDLFMSDDEIAEFVAQIDDNELISFVAFMKTRKKAVLDNMAEQFDKFIAVAVFEVLRRQFNPEEAPEGVTIQ